MSRSNTSNLGRPYNDRLLVEPDPAAEQTSFGLLLPENKDKAFSGTVVTGNDKIQAGERIIFSSFGIDEIKLEGKDYVLVSDSCVLYIYE